MTTLSHYPSITEAEFTEACQMLERRCYDNLGGTNWLSVKWDGQELKIKQTRGIAKIDNVGREIGGNATSSTRESLGGDLVEMDDKDMDAFVRHSPEQQARPAVDFSVLRSPSYSCPVLWFTLSSAITARTEDLETIYSRVVAPSYLKSLSGTGIMGGISLAHHPITDRPTFFVHPCHTPESMTILNDGSNLDPFQYLLLWFGIVPGSLGLHVPSRVAS